MAPSLLKVGLFFLTLVSSLQGSTGISDPVEVLALQGIKMAAVDVFNKLENWVGDDPCGTNWTGLVCKLINGTEYVTELQLWNMNFTGTLAPDLVNLTHLSIINFMWNNITGSIPPEIGNLSELTLLLLSGNKLTGTLPPELGNLRKLDRLQIDENNVSGPIPSSYQYLNKVKHFHMNNNSLNGSIPPELGRLEIIAHFLLDNNHLSGELPPELANISTLVIVQLDNNHFNGSIPASYKNMSKQLTKLSLRNCNLSGSIPDLSAITTLTYLDLSHNQLTGNIPSNLSQTLKTIDWSYNQLDGELPSSLYGLRNLELVLLQNNSLDGTFRADLLTHNPFMDADSLFILDLQNNNFTGFTSGALLGVSNVTLRLSGNPLCNGSSAPSDVCVEFNGVDANITTSATPKFLPPSCSADTCDASLNQELHYGLLAFNICRCVFPLVVGYRLKSPSFAIYQPYEKALQSYLSSVLNLFVYQVNASDFTWEPGPRLALNIKLLPGNDTNQFSSLDVSRLYNQFSIWNISGNRTFGPHEMLYFTIGFPYNVSVTAAAASRSGLRAGAIAGIVIGAAAFAAVLVAVVILVIARHNHKNIYAFPRKKAVRHHESIKIDGVKDFRFKEMVDATNNFDTEIGQGGYGKVYKASLADGLVVAIKRAHEGSLQGEKEFFTELEMLSRLHHRNLVTLIGFCDDEGEQMLIYEYMVNGTLRDHLKSSSEHPLDFATRLQIALGSAKGILYLHTEADPPIFHRDIKASNILLDKNMRAKVTDFGISKLAPVEEVGGGEGFGYVSTVVKGTPGYVDPEYFLTQKLSDKSDVYSFGVVLLELITGQEPIYKGKNLVREVGLAHEAGMVLSIMDQRMGSYPSECLELLLRLGMRCCMDEADDRPSMANVVQELEAIWRLMPHSDSKAFFESSPEVKGSAVKGYTGLAVNNPYVSSDIDGSGLVSGYIPSINPR